MNKANCSQSGESFYLTAPENRAVVILVHGVTGSLSDVRPLAEFLHQNNLDVLGISLTVQGAPWEDLDKIYYYQWYQAIEDQLKKLLQEKKEIFFVGHSFGGNLVLEMAYKYQRYVLVKGVVTIGLRVFIRNDWLMRWLIKRWNKLGDNKFRDWLDKKMRQHYEKTHRHSLIPLSTLDQVYKFINRYTKKPIPQLRPGALLIHAAEDRLTQAIGSVVVFEQIKSKDKELLIVPGDDRFFVQPDNQQKVFSKILDFIQKRISSKK